MKFFKRIILLVSIIMLNVLLYFYLIENRENDLDIFNSFNNESTMIQFIKSMDQILLCTISLNNNTFNFTDEQKLDFAVNYIIMNYGVYKDDIVYLEVPFVYEEDDTKYNSIGYVNKSIIENIIYDYYGDKDIIYDGYKFYDIRTNLVALVPYVIDKTSTNDMELLSIDNLDINKYVVICKYFRKFELKTNEFKIEYIIEKREDKQSIYKYNLESFKVFDSIMY